MIPTQEVHAAQRAYEARNYQSAVAQAKAALNKNERYTPAMLITAKAYFKLGKYEWVKTLGEMMKNAGASEAERSDIYQMLALMEVEKKNTPGAIELLHKAVAASPDNAVLWNNLGAQYLVVKNYREAGPALERAMQLQPAFAKAHLNLGKAPIAGSASTTRPWPSTSGPCPFPRYSMPSTTWPSSTSTPRRCPDGERRPGSYRGGLPAALHVPARSGIRPVQP